MRLPVTKLSERFLMRLPRTKVTVQLALRDYINLYLERGTSFELGKMSCETLLYDLTTRLKSPVVNCFFYSSHMLCAVLKRKENSKTPKNATEAQSHLANKRSRCKIPAVSVDCPDLACSVRFVVHLFHATFFLSLILSFRFIGSGAHRKWAPNGTFG